MPKSDILRDPLARYILEQKLVSPAMLKVALAKQAVTGDRLSIVLQRLGAVPRRVLLEAVLRASPEELRGEQFYSTKVPPAVLIENRTMIVTEQPGQVFLTTMGSERLVELALREFYPQDRFVFTPADAEQIETYLQALKNLMSTQSSVLERILRDAFGQGASDIHLIPDGHSCSVLFRLNGVRHHVHELSVDEYNTMLARVKDMSRMDLAEKRVPQDGAFSFPHNGKIIDFRVATVPQVFGEGAVLRILDSDRVEPNLSGLGITRVSEWRKGAARQNGLNLICGPTGSGKTTTLNASMREMDRIAQAIYTVEDPVELPLPLSGQVNANPQVGLDFARGLKAFLRADPDIIIVGEIRDHETALNAVKAGETGHLVFGTLHTNSISTAVARLNNIGIEKYALRSLLRSVLVQNLLRRVCTHCHGEGCSQCAETGYQGRMIVSECAYFSSEAEVDRLLAGEVWWPTLVDDAILKVRSGLTNAAEVLRLFGPEGQDALAKAGIA